MNNPGTVRNSWNTVYLPGSKYKNEPPVQFIDTISSTLKKQSLLNGKGLYIGCGNGRNYIPLIEKGLDLIGLDISDVALKQISDRVPRLKDSLVHLSFDKYQTSQRFDYIIAIQVFQHGNYDDLKNNFQKVVNLLKPGGLFFLRNRASRTLTSEKYEIIDKTPHGGYTVKYLSGTKEGLEIHFLSEGEIDELPKIGLTPIVTPYIIKTPRTPPEEGEMVHWEGVWRKDG